MTSNRLRSFVICGRLRGSNLCPARAAAHQTSPSCAMPPSGTDQTSALPTINSGIGVAMGSRPGNSQTATIAPMNTMFRRAGAAAAARKRLLEFRTPETQSRQ